MYDEREREREGERERVLIVYIQSIRARYVQLGIYQVCVCVYACMWVDVTAKERIISIILLSIYGKHTRTPAAVVLCCTFAFKQTSELRSSVCLYTYELNVYPHSSITTLSLIQIQARS